MAVGPWTAGMKGVLGAGGTSPVCKFAAAFAGALKELTSGFGLYLRCAAHAMGFSGSRCCGRFTESSPDGHCELGHSKGAAELHWTSIAPFVATSLRLHFLADAILSGSGAKKKADT